MKDLNLCQSSPVNFWGSVCPLQLPIWPPPLLVLVAATVVRANVCISWVLSWVSWVVTVFRSVVVVSHLLVRVLVSNNRVANHLVRFSLALRA
jgi:hypothetical protein